MTHKFTPGDTVSFRHDLVVGRTYGHLVWTEYMNDTFDKGVEYIIPEDYGDKEYCLREDYFLDNKYGLSLYVSDEMLESK